MTTTLSEPTTPEKKRTKYITKTKEEEKPNSHAYPKPQPIAARDQSEKRKQGFAVPEIWAKDNSRDPGGDQDGNSSSETSTKPTSPKLICDQIRRKVV